MEQWRIDNIVEMMHDKALVEIRLWIAKEENIGGYPIGVVDRDERKELIENIINEFRSKMLESLI